jgi:hypothetical protein
MASWSAIKSFLSDTGQTSSYFGAYFINAFLCNASRICGAGHMPVIDVKLPGARRRALGEIGAWWKQGQRQDNPAPISIY